LVSQNIFQNIFLKEKYGEFEVAGCRCTVIANGQCLLGGTCFGLAEVGVAGCQALKRFANRLGSDKKRFEPCPVGVTN
jgi:hypothetical protein